MAPNKVSRRVAAALAGLLLMALAVDARAATVTYDFTGSTTAYSLFKTFNSSPPGGPLLTVTANTVSDDGTVVTPVTGSGNGVGQWAGLGLGLKNGSNDNSHTVDGYGLNDLLVLSFASSVKILSATFSYVAQVTNGTDNFAFFADPNNDGSVAGNMVFSSEDIVNGPGYTGSYNFATDGFVDILSKTFGIGAIWDAVYQNCVTRYGHLSCTSYTLFDSFKLASITVSTGPFEIPNEVPLPAGLVMFLSGLAGLGWLGRKARFRRVAG